MSMSRRALLRRVGGAVAGGAGLGLGLTSLGVQAAEVQAATRRLKLTGAQEFTSACNFCSCGCGMVMHVRDGKLLNLEGDPDHVINEGALCSKGAGISAAHLSDQRVRVPLYRAPGSDRWQELTWDDALERIARKMKTVRDTTWIPTDTAGGAAVPANRTEALGFLGGAQNTNEECYLYAKMGRLLGTPYIEHQARL
jgi:formate dehydrogenase major subunit